ncbi:hypothetical protein ACX3O0_00105 [Homoserinimonas sp. A447]
MSQLVVGLAASLLPRAARDRYREQWLGELRDASEAGVRASDVAIGSLAFAVTLERPLPSLSRMPDAKVRSRARLAAGVALGAALLALTRYADIVTAAIWNPNPGVNFVIFTMSSLLDAFAVLGPIFAVALVTVTLGVSARIRGAVWLLALAGYSHVAQTQIDNYFYIDGDMLLSRGTVSYLVAIAVISMAVVLLRTEFRSLKRPSALLPRHRRIIFSALAGGALLLIATVCVVDSIVAWAGRTPLVFGGNANGAVYQEWLAHKALGEATVSAVFAVWAVLCGVVAVVVIAAGLSRRSTVSGHVVGFVVAVALIGMSYASVVDFLRLMTWTVEMTVPTELVMLLGRWVLVLVVLVSVGNLRFPRHIAVATTGDIVDGHR